MKNVLLFCTLITGLFACGGPAYIEGSFAEWDAIKPVKKSGRCEQWSRGIENENAAAQALEDIKDELTSWSPSISYVYQITNSEIFQYSVYYRHDDDSDLWGAWAEYDCDGLDVSTFVTAPKKSVEADLERQDVVETLESAGNTILKVQRNEFYTDTEGTIVSFTIHYYYSAGNNTRTQALRSEGAESFNARREDLMEKINTSIKSYILRKL